MMTIRGLVINGNETKVLSLLKKLGLTEYEARAYFTLLLLGKANAGVVAKKSGVYQSKIYEVLENLAEKGAVRIRSEEFPKKIEATALSQLTKRAVREKISELASIRKSGKKLSAITNKLQPIFQSNGKYLRVFKPRYRRVGFNPLPPTQNRKRLESKYV